MLCIGMKPCWEKFLENFHGESLEEPRPLYRLYRSCLAYQLGKNIQYRPFCPLFMFYAFCCFVPLPLFSSSNRLPPQTGKILKRLSPRDRHFSELLKVRCVRILVAAMRYGYPETAIETRQVSDRCGVWILFSGV